MNEENFEKAKILIKRVANLDVKDKRGHTLLHHGSKF